MAFARKQPRGHRLVQALAAAIPSNSVCSRSAAVSSGPSRCAATCATTLVAAAFGKRAQIQGVLVAEGVVDAALAQPGRLDQVVEAGCRISERPEPVPCCLERRWSRRELSGRAMSPRYLVLNRLV